MTIIELSPLAGAQADFVKSRAKYPFLAGGLGSGKTWAGCTRALFAHDWARDFRGAGVIVGTSFSTTERIMVNSLVSRFRDLGIDARFDRMRHVIEVSGHGPIYVCSARQAVEISGFEVAWAWLDEAPRMPERAAPHNVWENVVARLRHPAIDERYLSAWVTGTHEGPGTWVHRIWERRRDDDHPVFRARTEDNRFSAELARRIRSEYDGTLHAQYLEGGVCDGELSVLRHEALDRCLSSIASTRWVDGPSHPQRLYAGMDVGRTRSLTVIWIIAENADQTYTTRAVLTMSGVTFAEQEDTLAWAMETLGIRRISIDSTYNPQTAESFVARWGARVDPVRFDRTIKAELADKLAHVVNQGKVLIPDDDDVIQDLCSVKRVATPGGAVQYEAPYTRDGHADRFWALALAIRAAQLETSGRKPRAWWPEPDQVEDQEAYGWQEVGQVRL